MRRRRWPTSRISKHSLLNTSRLCQHSRSLQVIPLNFLLFIGSCLLLISQCC